MNISITDHWTKLVNQLDKNERDWAPLFDDLIHRYNEPHRHYHNLNHIEQMLDMSSAFNYSVELQLAIWFHDVIYSPTSHNNELKSGEYCAKKLIEIGISPSIIHEVVRLINLTKTHKTHHEDTLGKQLLDLDLAILGSDTDTYNHYVATIRKEYSIYPSMIYNPGRKKVIEHFLNSDHIYFTEEFAHLESIARRNLSKELKNYKS